MDNLAAKMDGAKRSLTIWFNTVMLALVPTLLALESSMPELKDALPSNVFAYLVVITTIGNKLIRIFKTTQALENK